MRALVLSLCLMGCIDADPRDLPVADVPDGVDLPDTQEPEPPDAGADSVAPDPDAATAPDAGDDAATPPPDTTPPDTTPPDTTTGEGVVGLAQAQALYGQFCAFCHGESGEGYAADGANALNHPAFLSTASDDLLRAAIAFGRPGTPMSAWFVERGGPLTGVEVEALVKLIRGWQTEPTVAFSDAPITGVTKRAEPLFATHCAHCHGADGMGGKYPSVANPLLLDTASDAYLRYAIAKGRVGTPMPEFETQLTPQGIDDLVTLIRSWEVDPTTPPSAQPNAEAPAVLNPEGPEPDLGDTRMVPAATVFAAYDAHAKMVLLDARPGGDYVIEHIAGAISVPFYAVDQHLDRLPQDTWIVTYCACPHAESELAADALEAAGYTKVRVLDEGFIHWKNQGYPTQSGPNP